MKKLDVRKVFIIRNPDDQNKPLFVLNAASVELCKGDVQAWLNAQKFDSFNYVHRLEIVPIKRDPFGGYATTVHADSKHVLQIEGERIELTYQEAAAYQKATRTARQYLRNNAGYGAMRLDYKLPKVVADVIRKHLNIAQAIPVLVSFTPDNQHLLIAGSATPFEFGRYFPAVDEVKNLLN